MRACALNGSGLVHIVVVCDEGGGRGKSCAAVDAAYALCSLQIKHVFITNQARAAVVIMLAWVQVWVLSTCWRGCLL